MATIAHLCAFLNAYLHLEAGTAEAYATTLRKEDLVSRSLGGRGNRGGAEATTTDAATLLLALLATDCARNAPEAIARFGTFSFAAFGWRVFTATGYEQIDAADNIDLSPFRQPFLEALAGWIDSYRRAADSAAQKTSPVAIGLDKTPNASRGWIVAGWPSLRGSGDPDGLVLATCCYTATGEPPGGGSVTDDAAAPLVRTASIPGAVFISLASLLGPLPVECATDPDEAQPLSADARAVHRAIAFSH